MQGTTLPLSTTARLLGLGRMSPMGVDDGEEARLGTIDGGDEHAEAGQACMGWRRPLQIRGSSNAASLGAQRADAYGATQVSR
jgi:hypothetical protein